MSGVRPTVWQKVELGALMALGHGQLPLPSQNPMEESSRMKKGHWGQSCIWKKPPLFDGFLGPPLYPTSLMRVAELSLRHLVNPSLFPPGCSGTWPVTAQQVISGYRVISDHRSTFSRQGWEPVNAGFTLAACPQSDSFN